jgi:FKBP-type peptidyl-prolyl cis-trans isomerase
MPNADDDDYSFSSSIIMRMTKRRQKTAMKSSLLGGILLCSCLSTTVLSFSSRAPQDSFRYDRRAALSTIATIPNLLLFSGPALASITKPLPQEITTVILDSPQSKIGVQLYDVKVFEGSSQTTTYSAVKSVQANGEAAVNGVKEGMIVLSANDSASVVNRIQRGPYPMVFQFYSLAEEMGTSSALQGLETYIRQQQEQVPLLREEEAKLSSKGTGLVVKTVKKAYSCDRQARRGDVVQINYEARVASPGGPIYDSTANRGGGPVTFVLGDGKAINGVDIGIGGMCEGEIRELDIPSNLGYGQAGSNIFDIPGDVRLWWRIELVHLDKKRKEQRKTESSG